MYTLYSMLIFVAWTKTLIFENANRISLYEASKYHSNQGGFTEKQKIKLN